MNQPDTTPIVQNIPEPLGLVLTKEDLARRWQVSISTIERLSRDRIHGIRSLRIRRNLRFRLCDVEEFEKRLVTKQRAF